MTKPSAVCSRTVAHRESNPTELCLKPLNDQESSVAAIRAASVAVAFIFFLICPQKAPAQAVILRNLTRIENVHVVDFGPDHIALSSGKLLPWDEVLSAPLTVERADDQAAFDLRIKTYGIELALLKQRLANGDLNGAASIAAPLFAARIENMTSIPTSDAGDPPDASSLERQASIAQLTHDTNFLIGALSFHHHFEKGDREAALVAFLVAADHRRFASDRWTTRMDSIQQQVAPPNAQAESFFNERIQPIWFDEKALKTSYRRLVRYFGQPHFRLQDPSADKSSVSDKLPATRLKIPPGVELYLASMEIMQIDPSLAPIQKKTVAARLRRAKTITQEMKRSAHRDDLLMVIGIVEEQLATFASEQPAKRSFAEKHPLAIYLRNAKITPELNAAKRSSIAESSSVEALLELLSIPAHDGSRYPHLASAAIAKVIEFAKSVGDDSTEQKLRAELTQKYSQTYHAKQFRR